ncbi:hypothetical protein QQ045_024252 [Rhodiola kirilowii]
MKQDKSGSAASVGVKKSKLAAAAGGGGATPCAACKLLRRRCSKDECTFAPYFPADDPVKFATVHKDLPEQHRGDAVSSLVYEANARVRDPVYGCVGAISALQQQIHVLQAQLALAQAEVLHLRSSQPAKTLNSSASLAAKGFTDGCAHELVPCSTSSSSRIASSCTAKSFLATDCSWW